VALAEVFGTAMSGRCADRPELAGTPIALEAMLPAVACRGGDVLLHRLFAPLGYEIEARRLPLDEQFPDWGESRYFHLTLRSTRRLAELLSHLYVLVPVLEAAKHYAFGEDEVEKLLARGAGWLAAHPEKELITERYLAYRRALTRAALDRLLQDEPGVEEAASEHDAEEATVEERVSLHTQRLSSVLEVLKASGARRVLDLGCGDGKLLWLLVEDRSFTGITGMDVSYRSLELAARRLRLDRMAPGQRGRVRLFQGSLTYRDARLAGYDAAAVVEVIEHLDPPRLAAFERCLFEVARPGTVVVTTPNVEYNVRFETLPAGHLRHRDHRFEWTRAEFEAWAGGVAGRSGYAVRFLTVGPVDEEVGAPTQMAVFSR
jgi:3' terminal RNA ribose 2'-O-methyltransferase Hen1